MPRGSAIVLAAFLCESCASLSPPRPVTRGALCEGSPTPSRDVTIQTGSVVLRRDPNAIQKTIRSNFDHFRSCYKDALWRRREATGRVQLRFVIDESGHVTKSCVEPPVFADGDAVDCILGRLNTIAFGAGSRVTVVYPIVLLTDR